MRRQGVIHVRDPDNLGEQRHLITAKSQRVATAVQPFVVKPHDGPNRAERLQWRAQRIAMSDAASSARIPEGSAAPP
jgi:hypothetical protein